MSPKMNVTYLIFFACVRVLHMVLSFCMIADIISEKAKKSTYSSCPEVVLGCSEVGIILSGRQDGGNADRMAKKAYLKDVPPYIKTHIWERKASKI